MFSREKLPKPRPEEVIMKRFTIPAIAIASLLFAIIWTVSATPVHKPTTPPSPPPQSTSEQMVGAVGLVEPESENISISCPVSGMVTGVYANAGDRVHGGQKLFSLDDRDLQAALHVKEAALQAAQARLKRLEEEPRAEEVPPAEAKVSEETANLADAEVQMKLIESVTDRRAVRQEDVLRRRIAYQAAQARLSEARSQLALLKAGAWAPDIAVARSEVSEADQQVKQVKTQIERLTMTAPMDGIILQKRVRLGQFAECGPTSEPLMIMGGGTHLNIRADIDESDAWRMRPNTTAIAYVRGDTRDKLALQFVRFEPYVLPKKSLTGDATERVDTRVLQAIYRINDENATVYVGQQMDVYIETPLSLTGRSTNGGLHAQMQDRGLKSKPKPGGRQ
jgi:multidrug resistance efflux pump